MTKSELIAQLAQRNSLLVAKDAECVVKTLLDAMARTLTEGNRIEIRGFGSFSLNYRSARVPQKYVPHFKAGRELRERVQEGKEVVSSR
jgi:integration host factor subunit beta